MYLSENLLEVKKYRPATLHTGKSWYVDFYAYRPDTRTMERKQIKLNNIKSITERRKYAAGLIIRINSELEKGWNPFICEQQSNSYALLTKVIDEFMRLVNKRLLAGELRDSTVHSYSTYSKKIGEYLLKHKASDINVYQFNKDFIIKFLDNLYHTDNVSSRTRDNYLKFIRLFCSYLVERNYLKVSPAASISVLGKKMRAPKNRSVISVDMKRNISNYLETTNKHYLLACQILYFCMIRPKEMTYIRISHINLERSVIFVPGETAKNYKNAVVTIPAALHALIEDLHIKDFPGDFYLFSDGFKPGEKYRTEKQFSHYWARNVRKALDLPLSVQFYSMKDTGITDMIRSYNDPILARDQARHHDLSITNLYTPQDMMQANETIKNDSRKF